MSRVAKVGRYHCGEACPLLVIAGPCVLQDESISAEIAETLQSETSRLNMNLVFKGSFDKANRTSIESFRGLGLKDGISHLCAIREKFGIPVTTDIHEPNQAAEVAEICELIQIPAFLARQTDLLVAAANTGRAVNVKKGQFMAPWDMKHVATKLQASGCENVLLCERGTFFGYGQLVNDMRALVEMRQLGVPVVYDATHSVQKPSGLGATTGGNREMVAPLARAAIAVGIDAIFFETHPDPESSPSDGPNMIPLDQVKSFLSQLDRIRKAISDESPNESA